jgi:ribosomal-protein-alanine N-acetyltransferase
MRTIETARFLIRSLIPDDLDAYHQQIYSDPEVMLYLPGGRPRTREETTAVLDYFVSQERQHGFAFGAVLDKISGELIGHCGLNRLSDGAVEVGYAFARSRWGQGCAPEAARACLRYGFETLLLDEIIALAMPPNLASQRVMQKIGMTPMGTTQIYYQTELVLYRLRRADFVPADTFYRVV